MLECYLLGNISIDIALILLGCPDVINISSFELENRLRRSGGGESHTLSGNTFQVDPVNVGTETGTERNHSLIHLEAIYCADNLTGVNQI